MRRKQGRFLPCLCSFVVKLFQRKPEIHWIADPPFADHFDAEIMEVGHLYNI